MPGISDQSIFRTICGVALRVHGVRYEFDFLHRHRRSRQRTLVVHIADHRARKTQDRGADHDPVEVIGKPLRRDQPLSTAR
jgi:hypothetical protein